MQSAMQPIRCRCMPLAARAPVRARLATPLSARPAAGLSSLASSFSGLSLCTARRTAPQQAPLGRGGVVVVFAGGQSMGNTKRGTRRRRTRTSGYRTRRLTVGGRKVLKARRVKGRHVLCPAANYRKL